MIRLARPAAILAVLISTGFMVFGAVTENATVIGVFAVVGLAGATALYAAFTRPGSGRSDASR